VSKLAGLAALLVLSACTGVSTAGTSTTTTSPTTTTSAVSATTTTVPPTECPEAPYELTFLPPGIGQGVLDTASISLDVWTSVAGSKTTLIPRSDDTVAIALIRGTLPAVDWPGEKGEIFIDGTRAAVGPHPDGTWVAGWYEEPGDRCDLYTMVFYPPWNPTDVRDVLEGMNRVGG
jgi:hypothetical protein